MYKCVWSTLQPHAEPYTSPPVWCRIRGFDQTLCLITRNCYNNRPKLSSNRSDNRPLFGSILGAALGYAASELGAIVRPDSKGNRHLKKARTCFFKNNDSLLKRASTRRSVSNLVGSANLTICTHTELFFNGDRWYISEHLKTSYVQPG